MTAIDADATWFRRAFALALMLVPALAALYLVPIDDGLRHVAVAFHGGRTWGEVYPFSAFARFADYDPWWGYDASLRMLGAVLATLPVGRMLQQFLALKLASAALVGAALWLLTRRARIATTTTDARGFLLAVVITMIALVEPLQRFASARPFAFGTLWLAYAVGRTGAVRGFVSAAILTALYPYLAWIYVLAGAAAHLWRGSRVFALGALAASIAGLAFRPQDFTGLLAALGDAGTVRAAVASSIRITELLPLWQRPHTAVFVALVALWLVPRLDRDARRLRTEHVMALCFVPVSLVHARYFVDVVVPLLFVAHGADAMVVVRAQVTRLAWRGRAGATDSGVAPRGSRVMPAFLAVANATLLAMLVTRSAHQHADLERVGEDLAPIPPGSLVLTEFNLQYRLLFARPDLSLIPSSELGFPSADIRDAYIAYVNDGHACTLASATNAAFVVDSSSQELPTNDRDCLELVRDDGELRLWRVVPPSALALNTASSVRDAASRAAIP